MSADALTVEDLPGLLESEQFRKITPDQRDTVINGALNEAFQAQVKDPQFNEEAFRSFGEVANAVRAKAASMQTIGETAKKYAGQFAEGLGGLAASITGTAADASALDAEGNARTPFSTVGNLIDNSLKKAGDTLQTWEANDSPSNKRLQGQLNSLKSEIDKGFVPIKDPDKLDSWLTKRATEIAHTQRDYYTAAGDVSPDDHLDAFAASNSIIAPANAALVSRYMTTRDPAAWAALEKSLRTTPTRAQLDKEEHATIEDSPVFQALKGFEDLNGSVIPQGFAEQTIKGSGDPINIAALALPMLRGAKLAEAAVTGSAVKRELGSLFKGTVEGVAMGEAGLDIQDPNASFQDHIQTGKNMIGMSLGMHTIGRVAGSAWDRFGPKKDDVAAAPDPNAAGQQPQGGAQSNPQPQPNQPGPQGAAAGQGKTFDPNEADAAVDEVFGTGAAKAAQPPPPQPQQAGSTPPPDPNARYQRQPTPEEQRAAREAADKARQDAADAYWKQKQADWNRQRQQRQQQQSQQSQQSSQQQSQQSSGPQGPKAKTFSTQEQFDSFMDEAAKNGDVVEAKYAWGMNQKFFKTWFSKTKNLADDHPLHDFRYSVIDGRHNNADFAAYKAERDKARAEAAKQQPEQAGQTAGGSQDATQQPQGEPTGGTGAPGGGEQSAQQPPVAAPVKPAETPQASSVAGVRDAALAMGDTKAAEALNTVAALSDQRAREQATQASNAQGQTENQNAQAGALSPVESKPPVSQAANETPQGTAQQEGQNPQANSQPQASVAPTVQFGQSAPSKGVKNIRTVEGHGGGDIASNNAEYPLLNLVNKQPIHLPARNTESGKGNETARWRENIGKYWHQFLFDSDPKALRPDQVAQIAFNEGHISAPTADALQEGLMREISNRGSVRGERAKQKATERTTIKQLNAFDKDAQTGDTPVSTNHVELPDGDYRGLLKGDKLTIKGAEFEVQDVHTDEDGNVLSAQLKDGPKYGVQTIGPDHVLLVDEFIPREPKKVAPDDFDHAAAAAQVENTAHPFSADPNELIGGDVKKTQEQLDAEKAAADEKLRKIQQAQDIRVGAAKPLRAAGDVRPENDMFDASKNEADIFNQPKPSKVEQPTLVGSHVRDSQIRLDFDATGKIPTLEELQNAFGKNTSIEKFAPDIISGTRGVVSFRLDIMDDKGRMSSKAAQESYKTALGSVNDYNGKSAFQISGNLADRFKVGRAVAGDPRAINEVIPTRGRNKETGKNPLLTAAAQGLPPITQAGHKAAIKDAINANDPFHAADAVRYGFEIPQGYVVGDDGIARFIGTVQADPVPDVKTLEPTDTDSPKVQQIKNWIAKAMEDQIAAQEDGDEMGAAAITRAIAKMQADLKAVTTPKAKEAPMRDVHEMTRDEAKAAGKSPKEHMEAVKAAVASSQNVPDAVLADYSGRKWADAEIERRVQDAEPVNRSDPHDSVEEALERAIDASAKRSKARRKNTYSNPFAGIADDVWRDALKTALFIYRTTKNAAKAAKAAYDYIKSKVPHANVSEAQVQAALDKMHFATGDTPIADLIRNEWNEGIANLKAGFSAMKAKDMLAAVVDGADNAPSIPALQAANHVRLRFGENPTLPSKHPVNMDAKLNQEGATMVAEAYRHVRSKKQAIEDARYEAAMEHWAKTPGATQPTHYTVDVSPAEARIALTQQIDRITHSTTAEDARKYVPVMEHGLQNFDDLDQLRQFAHKFTDAQVGQERLNGFDTNQLRDYVRRVYENVREKRGWTEPDAMFDGGDGGTGGKTFMKGRVFDSIFDAMDAGYVPASVNIADLVESRIAAGQHMIEHKLVRDMLFNQKDETTGEPILKEHSPGKQIATNYKVVSMAGTDVQVHKRYAGFLKRLYGESVIRQGTAGRALMKGNMTVKHFGLMVDTYHAGRVSFKQLAATGRMGYGRALSVLEYLPSDLAHLESIGHITAEEHQWALGKIGVAKELVHAGLNLNRLMDAVDRDALSLVQKVLDGIPGLGALARGTEKFNHWVFQKVTRGAMLEVGLNFFEHNLKKMPRGEAMRLASKETNEMFGNIGRQGFAQSKTMQDMLRIAFLAPQWSEGTLRSEMRGAAQTGEAAIKFLTTGKLHVGNSARVMLSTIAAVLVAGQLINYATKGHTTLENEEGHQSDIWIPGGKHGFYISPFTFTNQYMEQAHRYYSQNGGNAPGMGVKVAASIDAGAQILANKIHPIARAGKTLLTGHDYFGRPLPGFSRIIEAGKTAAFLPIPVNPILKSNPGEMPSITFEGNKPGAWQKQLFASTGVHIMTAEGPVQKMYALARPFRADDTALAPQESKYTLLRQDVGNGFKGYAWERMKDLVSKGEATIAHMDESFGWHGSGVTFHFQPRPFTGSKANEPRFLNSLTPEQQQWHADAIAEQRTTADTYKEIRNEHLQELRQMEATAKEVKRKKIQGQ